MTKKKVKNENAVTIGTKNKKKHILGKKNTSNKPYE